MTNTLSSALAVVEVALTCNQREADILRVIRSTLIGSPVGGSAPVLGGPCFDAPVCASVVEPESGATGNQGSRAAAMRAAVLATLELEPDGLTMTEIAEETALEFGIDPDGDAFQKFKGELSKTLSIAGKDGQLIKGKEGGQPIWKLASHAAADHEAGGRQKGRSARGTLDMIPPGQRR